MAHSINVGNWHSISKTQSYIQVDLNYLECTPVSHTDSFLALHTDHDICSQFMLNKEQHSDSDLLSDKAVQKTKRIVKREKARQRVHRKDPLPIDPRLEKEKRFQLPEDFDSLQPQLKKKLQQKIKNRISAQNSRDKQREYIRHLEEQNKYLTARNLELAQEQDTCQSDSPSAKQCQSHKVYSDHTKLTVLLFLMLALTTSLPSRKTVEHSSSVVHGLQRMLSEEAALQLVDKGLSELSWLTDEGQFIKVQCKVLSPLRPANQS